MSKLLTSAAIAKLDAGDRVVFDLGRHARKGGIRREDTPKVGKEAKLWEQGWDYEDAALG